jgi:hypothetical protein
MRNTTLLTITALALLCSASMQSMLSHGNGCTRDHCYYCASDDKVQWCTRCGNGKAISSETGTDRHCDKDLTVENCRAAPVNDPTNVDLCGECDRGFYLESPTSCVAIELEGCSRPYKESADGPVLCNGCDGKFLLDDKTGCANETDEEFPANCLIGGLVSQGKCDVCNHGWFPSVTGMSCEEERITGCAIYHPNDTQECFTCDAAEGFYAVRGEVDGDNVY